MKKHKHYKEIIAWSEGKEIQVFFNNNWNVITNPGWYDHQEYRVKPDPIIIPFQYKDKEELRGRWIKNKDSKNEEMITLFSYKHVNKEFRINNMLNTQILKYFEFLDGSPCGKYVV